MEQVWASREDGWGKRGQGGKGEGGNGAGEKLRGAKGQSRRGDKRDLQQLERRQSKLPFKERACLLCGEIGKPLCS